MIDKPQDRERRLVLRVLDRWQGLRGERPFAAWRELDPAVFAGDWRYCFGLAVDPAGDAGGDPGFVYIGDTFGDAAPAPRLASECRDGTLLKLAVEFFPQVLDKRIPISVGGTGRDRGAEILFRAILLPLSDDGSRIDGLLGAANCRAVGAASG
jgi:hypothetical protein